MFLTAKYTVNMNVQICNLMTTCAHTHTYFVPNSAQSCETIALDLSCLLVCIHSRLISNACKCPYTDFLVNAYHHA